MIDADRDAGRWLIVGLGNPGSRYAANRHNVGFMVVEALAELATSVSFRPNARFKGELAVGRVRKHDLVLLKPQTFMNLSGESAQPVAHFYRVPLERIVVVHDDVDLELGRLKIKRGGGDAGHNGLRSLTERFGSGDYVRIRFGVGRPALGEVADYVLSDFRHDEHELLADTVKRAKSALLTVLSSGVPEAMNRYNRDPKPKGAKKADTAATSGTAAATDEAPKGENKTGQQGREGV